MKDSDAVTGTVTVFGNTGTNTGNSFPFLNSSFELSLRICEAMEEAQVRAACRQQPWLCENFVQENPEDERDDEELWKRGHERKGWLLANLNSESGHQFGIRYMTKHCAIVITLNWKSVEDPLRSDTRGWFY
jgi:hypothetical protein